MTKDYIFVISNNFFVFLKLKFQCETNLDKSSVYTVKVRTKPIDYEYGPQLKYQHSILKKDNEVQYFKH